jgi:hypothetical protein
VAGLKPRVRAAVAFAATVALAGCGGPKTAADYAKMQDDTLCASYGDDDRQRDIVRAEIDKRGLIPSYDWNRVSHGDVGYGMHRCSVLAAWHAPASVIGSGTAIEIWTFHNDRVARFQNGAVVGTTDFR